MFCPMCGKDIGDKKIKYCPMCGSPVSVDSASTQASGESFQQSSQQTGNQGITTDIRRIAKLLLIVSMICFFFPFVTVSCSGEQFTYSGFEVATKIITDEEKSFEEFEDFSPNIYLIGTLVLAAVGLCFAWNKKNYKNTTKMAIIGCSAGGAICLGLFRSTFFDYYDFGYLSNALRVEFEFGWTASLISLCGAALMAFVSTTEDDRNVGNRTSGSQPPGSVDTYNG